MLSRRTVFPLATLLVISGCSESSSTDVDDQPEVSTLLVDAKESWGYASFDGDLATELNVTDPASSTDWDLGLYATSAMLNGGDSGPGDVVGYCVCQNEGATDDDIIAMTREGELPDFEAVTTADVPGDEDAWIADAVALAIDGWYTYDFQTHTVSAAPENTWYVRTSSGDAFAKLHVTEISGQTQAHAGEVTLEFGLQPASADEFGAAQALTVDLSGGDVYVDLDDASTSSSAEAGWDIHLSGYDIRVNGGDSGSGDAAAALTDTPFEEIDTATGIPDVAFSSDEPAGVFEDHPWYRYDLEGDHQIWPTFDVYLIRTGEDVYKVQFISYYHPDGRPDDARYITFRYELLEE